MIEIRTTKTYQVVTFGDDKWTGEAVFFAVGDYKAPQHTYVKLDTIHENEYIYPECFVLKVKYHINMSII